MKRAVQSAMRRGAGDQDQDGGRLGAPEIPRTEGTRGGCRCTARADIGYATSTAMTSLRHIV